MGYEPYLVRANVDALASRELLRGDRLRARLSAALRNGETSMVRLSRIEARGAGRTTVHFSLQWYSPFRHSAPNRAFYYAATRGKAAEVCLATVGREFANLAPFVSIALPSCMAAVDPAKGCWKFGYVVVGNYRCFAW